MCFSLAACGAETPNADESSEPQASEDQQESAENTDASEIDWQSQLCATEWYCVGIKIPNGVVFRSDGTVGGYTWELLNDQVIWTAKDGEKREFDIRTINNIHFLVDLTDGISYYQYGKHDWSNIPVTAIEITLDNWQEYLEIVSVGDDYHLKLKTAYRKAVMVDKLADCDSWFSVCYSQGDKESEAREVSFQWGDDYIDVENPDEIPLTIEKIEGTLYIIDGLL